MDPPPIGLPAFVFGHAQRPPPFAYSAIPDDLDCGIAGKRARQQLEGGEMATSHDDELRLSHGVHA